MTGTDSPPALFLSVPVRSGWGSPDGTCPEGYPGSCTSELGRYSDRETLHYVQLTYDFELSRYEITEAEFEGLMGWNPMDTYDSDCTYGCGDDHPMKYLSLVRHPGLRQPTVLGRRLDTLLCTIERGL